MSLSIHQRKRFVSTINKFARMIYKVGDSRSILNEKKENISSLSNTYEDIHSMSMYIEDLRKNVTFPDSVERKEFSEILDGIKIHVKKLLTMIKRSEEVMTNENWIEEFTTNLHRAMQSIYHLCKLLESQEKNDIIECAKLMKTTKDEFCSLASDSCSSDADKQLKNLRARFEKISFGLINKISVIIEDSLNPKNRSVLMNLFLDIMISNRIYYQILTEIPSLTLKDLVDMISDKLKLIGSESIFDAGIKNVIECQNSIQMNVSQALKKVSILLKAEYAGIDRCGAVKFSQSEDFALLIKAILSELTVLGHYLKKCPNYLILENHVASLKAYAAQSQQCNFMDSVYYHDLMLCCLASLQDAFMVCVFEMFVAEFIPIPNKLVDLLELCVKSNNDESMKTFIADSFEQIVNNVSNIGYVVSNLCLLIDDSALLSIICEKLKVLTSFIQHLVKRISTEEKLKSIISIIHTVWVEIYELTLQTICSAFKPHILLSLVHYEVKEFSVLFSSGLRSSSTSSAMQSVSPTFGVTFKDFLEFLCRLSHHRYVFDSHGKDLATIVKEMLKQTFEETEIVSSNENGMNVYQELGSKLEEIVFILEDVRGKFVDWVDQSEFSEIKSDHKRFMDILRAEGYTCLMISQSEKRSEAIYALILDEIGHLVSTSNYIVTDMIDNDKQRDGSVSPCIENWVRDVYANSHENSIIVFTYSGPCCNVRSMFQTIFSSTNSPSVTDDELILVSYKIPTEPISFYLTRINTINLPSVFGEPEKKVVLFPIATKIKACVEIGLSLKTEIEPTEALPVKSISFSVNKSIRYRIKLCDGQIILFYISPWGRLVKVTKTVNLNHALSALVSLPPNYSLALCAANGGIPVLGCDENLLSQARQMPNISSKAIKDLLKCDFSSKLIIFHYDRANVKICSESVYSTNFDQSIAISVLVGDGGRSENDSSLTETSYETANVFEAAKLNENSALKEMVSNLDDMNEHLKMKTENVVEAPSEYVGLASYVVRLAMQVNRLAGITQLTKKLSDSEIISIIQDISSLGSTIRDVVMEIANNSVDSNASRDMCMLLNRVDLYTKQLSIITTVKIRSKLCDGRTSNAIEIAVSLLTNATNLICTVTELLKACDSAMIRTRSHDKKRLNIFPKPRKNKDDVENVNAECGNFLDQFQIVS